MSGFCWIHLEPSQKEKDSLKAVLSAWQSLHRDNIHRWRQLRLLNQLGPPLSQKKDAAYYDRMREEYRDFIKGNKLLTILEALNVVTTMTISLLTTDVKTCKLVGISREAIEEAFKSLTRPNVMWDILLATKDEAKQIAGNILMTKALRLQTAYMRTHRTRIALHWVPIDITETMWELSSLSLGRSGSFWSWSWRRVCSQLPRLYWDPRRLVLWRDE